MGILENAEPNPEDMLIIEVWDVDQTTADDLMAVAEIPVPTTYGENVGEQKIELKDPETKQVNGEMVIDQLHFIKQKVRRYMGPQVPLLLPGNWSRGVNLTVACGCFHFLD